MTTTNGAANPKVTRGNRRTGSARNHRTYPGRKAGNLPWRKDPLIIERVSLIRTLKAQGFESATAMLPPVNELMRRRSQPEVVVDTVYDDFHRLKEIQEEERLRAKGVEEEAIAQHIESWNEVKRQAWRAFHSAGAQSLNRGSYLNTIASTEEKIARIDGSLTNRADVEVTLHNGDRDLDSEIEDIIARRMAKPRLVVEGKVPLETDRSA